MIDTNYRIMSWNVRGLNAPTRRSAVREVAQANKISILNLQETKIEAWTSEMACDVGGNLLQGCVVLPAVGTRGGASIFWDKQIVDITDQIIASFSITAKVRIISTGHSFWMTTVYGPTDDQQKANFLSELAVVAPAAPEPWMLNDDFNMIYQARDKNNSNINRRMMGCFRRAIDLAGLKEVKCKNRRFTWSSEREDPTLCSIDKVFCNLACEDMHPNFVLMAASTSFSDHCPLVLANGVRPVTRARFRFENFWTVFPHFQETVQHAWERPVCHDCPFVRLKKKMERVVVDLTVWSKSVFGGAKLQFHIANEVIMRLDAALEARPLSPEELHLRKQLKLKVLGLAAIERARKKQASRISWLRAGDANSKFFHARVLSRRKKYYIHSIKHGDAIVTEPREKAKLAFDHFARGLGDTWHRSCTLNWDML